MGYTGQMAPNGVQSRGEASGRSGNPLTRIAPSVVSSRPPEESHALPSCAQRQIPSAGLLRFVEVDQTGALRRLELTRSQVEGTKFVFEIDMEPLTARLARFCNR